MKSTDQAGSSWLTTFTVLGEGSFQGKSVFRVADDTQVILYDRASRNWIATLRQDQVRYSVSPNNGIFSWPLEVDKAWTVTYEYQDHQRGRRFPRSRWQWRVAAHETVAVPGGTFKAFRLEGASPSGTWTVWYAPEVALIVKEVNERYAGHYLGPGRVVHELVRHAATGGERWYGVSLEAVQNAIQRGEGRAALAFYEGAAKDFESRGMPLEAVEAYRALVQTARPLGVYQQGLRSGLRALELLKAAPRTDTVVNELCNIHFQMGLIYRGVGDLAQARRSLEEGAQISQGFATAQSRLFWTGVFSRALGDLAYARSDYRSARDQAAEAVRVLEKFLADQSASTLDPRRRAGRSNLGWALVALGNAERRLGNTAAAEQALNRAAEISKELGAQELEIGARQPLGYMALTRRDFPAALREFEQIRRVATTMNQPGFLMWAYNGIGWSHYEEKRYGDAFEAFKQAVTLVEDVRGALQDTTLRSGFVEDKQDMYHGAVWSAVLLDKPDDAFSLAERGRSRAFLDLLGTQTVLSKGRTRALVDEEIRLRARLGEAKALADDAAEDGERAAAQSRVAAAEQVYREFLDRVRKESVEQASLMAVEPVTLKEIQALLPEGTTLIEYLVSRRASLAWVINRTTATVVRLPIPRDELVAEVRAFRQGIEGQAPLPDAQSRAAKLHQRLFATLRPHIRGDRVVIVPHDVLHYLPFGALRSSSGRWLVEDYSLSTLPSASVLKYLGGKGQASGDNVLALGNPDLGPALNLRYAEREAQAIAQQFPHAQVLVRANATEASAKALGGKARVLHFATHGELSEQDPLRSALLLVPGGAEDGRLEVREIFTLDLSARLVVLSACETGLGQLSSGDEIVGLQRAFLYAGTSAVVTTLWKVDDRASFFLMRAFYKEIATQEPPAALRAAQRATMREFPHPYAWAAFGLAGR